MHDLGFEVLERGDGLPVRVRSVFAPYVYFAAPDRPTKVLVKAETATQMRASAAHAQPTEVGGLLVGRRFRDRAGPYVVILGALQTPLSDGSPSSITLSPERTSELRAHAAQMYPSMDVVGWWHSHTYPGGYSKVDLASQYLWSDPMHVGLLVFAKGDPWAASYLGPASVRLTMVETNDSPDMPISELAGRTGWPTHQSTATDSTDRSGRTRWFWKKKPNSAKPGTGLVLAGNPANDTPGKQRQISHLSGTDLRTVTLCVLVVLLALSVLLLSAGITNLTYR